MYPDPKTISLHQYFTHIFPQFFSSMSHQCRRPGWGQNPRLYRPCPGTKARFGLPSRGGPTVISIISFSPSSSIHSFGLCVKLLPKMSTNEQDSFLQTFNIANQLKHKISIEVKAFGDRWEKLFGFSARQPFAKSLCGDNWQLELVRCLD